MFWSCLQAALTAFNWLFIQYNGTVMASCSCRTSHFMRPARGAFFWAQKSLTGEGQAVARVC